MKRWLQILCFATAIFLRPPSPATAQSVEQRDWGKLPDGRPVHLFTLESGNGVTADLSNYGALLQRLECPDRDGRTANILLSHASCEEALSGGVFGSVIGRFANRIDKGGFSIDGSFHKLESVNPRTGVHIHGGKTGFHRQLWETASLGTSGKGAYVEFSLTSHHGHEGYPGEVNVNVRYSLSPANVLRIDYRGRTDQPTHLNLTNHAYFNLSGSGTIENHTLHLEAGHWLEVDDRKVPTGTLLPVAGTAFDFRTPRTIGSTLAEIDSGGYDHCFVIDSPRGSERLVPFAMLEDPSTGRRMSVSTTKPGVQVYTANHFSGNPFPQWGGICFETQFYPDTPNQPGFPPSLLRPGETYQHTTEFHMLPPK